MRSLFFVFALLFGMVETSSADVKIEMEKVYEVHMPIIVKAVDSDKPAEGADVTKIYSWEAYGDDDVHMIEVKDGECLHVWAKPGKHKLKVEVLTIDWKNKKFTKKVARFDFKVVNSDDPDRPDPVDPDDPNPEFSDKFAKAIFAIGKRVDRKHWTKLRDVGGNYGAVAGQAAATSGWTPSRMLSSVKMRNLETLTKAEQDALRDSFFKPLAIELSNAVSGKTLKDHIKFFKLVDEGLSKLK